MNVTLAANEKVGGDEERLERSRFSVSWNAAAKSIVSGILGELNKIESEIKTGQDEVELTGIAAPGQCGERSFCRGSDRGAELWDGLLKIARRHPGSPV